MNVGMDTAIEGVDAFIGILEVLLVILALAVTTSDSVSQAVRLYQWQSVVLAVVTSLSVSTAAAANDGTTSDPFSTLLLVLLVALLPAMLAFTIRPLLHRATLAKASQSIGDDLKMLFVAVIWPFFEKFTGLRTRLTLVQTDQLDATPGLRTRFAARLALYQNLERDAEALWQARQSIQTRTVAPVLFIGLLAIAVLVAYSVPPLQFDMPARVGLAVALALNLVGLFNMIIKQDIISQVIGLLIMDQGLYLAVVKIVKIPVPATYFVISLYFYTLITVFILLILLPKLRATAQSIDLTEIAHESDLKSS